MGPTIDSGDIDITEPHNDGTSLNPGNVIVFDDPAREGHLTHRIVAVDPDGNYVTRGVVTAVVLNVEP